MKLLLCNSCGDIFNLDIGRLKQCRCGTTKGLYINNQDAVVNGNGTSIAIGNGALMNARCAADIPSESRAEAMDKNRITHAWVRAHEGPENPHTRVDTTLGT